MVFSCLTFCTDYNGLPVLPHCCRWQNFRSFSWLHSIPLYISGTASDPSFLNGNMGGLPLSPHNPFSKHNRQGLGFSRAGHRLSLPCFFFPCSVADKVAHLMGVNFRELQKGITRPQVKVSNKFVQEGQNMEQCQNPIGALGKTVYDKMFKWLVVRINKTLDAKMQREFCTGTLDAAGFEIFEGYLASLCRSHPPLIRTFSPGFSRFSPSTWGQPISVCSWPPASGLQKVPSSCIGAKSQQVE